MLDFLVRQIADGINVINFSNLWHLSERHTKVKNIYSVLIPKMFMHVFIEEVII